MSRKNVRINLPVDKPDALLALASKVMKRFTKDGEQGPLGSIDMPAFGVIVEKAKAAREAALQLHAEAEVRMQEAHSLLGIEKGQTKRTTGTLYHLLALIRDQLLVAFVNKEEMLSEYGFKTVITSTVPRRGSE